MQSDIHSRSGIAYMDEDFTPVPGYVDVAIKQVMEWLPKSLADLVIAYCATSFEGVIIGQVKGFPSKFAVAGDTLIFQLGGMLGVWGPHGETYMQWPSWHRWIVVRSAETFWIVSCASVGSSVAARSVDGRKIVALSMRSNELWNGAEPGQFIACETPVVPAGSDEVIYRLRSLDACLAGVSTPIAESSRYLSHGYRGDRRCALLAEQRVARHAMSADA